MNPKTLHLGSRGDAVKALQSMLKRYDPALKPDGHFGPLTERAVRLAQRRLGLFPPDGLAGPVTLGALAKAAKPAGAASHTGGLSQWLHSLAREAQAVAANLESTVEEWLSSPPTPPPAVPKSLVTAVKPAIRAAQQGKMPAGVVKKPAAMTLSEQGRQFVFRHEAGNGVVTAHLHFPGGASGVTLGPGYDMRERSEADITADLIAVNVPPATAAAAAKGAGLRKKDAIKFCADNKALLTLTLDQQVRLQRVYKGRYEDKVRAGITIPLQQYEFDALVSYAGNPGTNNGWLTTCKLVNQHKPVDAMEVVKQYVYSDHKWNKGLRNRRDAEAKLFLFGDYKA